MDGADERSLPRLAAQVELETKRCHYATRTIQLCGWVAIIRGFSGADMAHWLVYIPVVPNTSPSPNRIT